MRLIAHRGKWAAYIDRKRYSTGLAATAENLPAAERQARDIVAERARALAGDTCATIMQAYLDDMPRRATPKQPSENYKLLVKTVGKFFGEHKPHEVTREECRAYAAARRAEGRADGSIRTELAVLAAALRWHDPKTPARFDMPSPGQPRDRWLSRDEFAALLDAAPDHLKTWLHVAICTGARKEAVLQMTWSTHVDFERGTLWPGFKAGGKNRAKPIPMTDACRTWLLQAREKATCDFVVEWRGGPVKDVKKALGAAYKAAGVTGVSAPAHVVRHTAGAWMAIDGVPLLEIARRLGHSSQQTTERHYAHLHPDHMGASTKALEV